MYIVIAILIFGVLIAIHELGHFTAAKSLGVKVNEFAVGMGPAIVKKQRGETLYSLRCLPIGGYCAMEGEDEETGDPRAFTAQPWWKKLIILAAGSFMNFLLGFLIILLLYAGKSFAPPTITAFMDGCPYEGADALQVGDTFYTIDGHRIWFTDNVSLFLGRGDGTYDIVVVRDGEKVELKDFALTLRDYAGETSQKYGFYFGAVDSGAFAGLKYAWYNAMDFVREVWLALSDLVAGAVGLNQLSGPVGIISMINQVGTETAASSGVGAALENVAYFAAFIAINLSVMNLLPLPALDGGRIFFLFINAVAGLIFRRRIDPKYEGYVHAAGMVLLLGLMAFVMYNDISRLIVK
jgi:regulator of sigma E protease